MTEEYEVLKQIAEVLDVLLIQKPIKFALTDATDFYAWTTVGLTVLLFGSGILTILGWVAKRVVATQDKMQNTMTTEFSRLHKILTSQKDTVISRCGDCRTDIEHSRDIEIEKSKIQVDKDLSTFKDAIISRFTNNERRLDRLEEIPGIDRRSHERG